MAQQVRFLFKGLATGTTLIGPVPCVHLAVLHQTVLQAEGLSAQLTTEGFLTRVVPLVAEEVGDPAEGLATLEARKGPGT